MPAIRQRDEAMEDVAGGQGKRARRIVAPPVPSDHLPVKRLGGGEGVGIRAKPLQGAGRGSDGGQRGVKESERVWWDRQTIDAIAIAGCRWCDN